MSSINILGMGLGWVMVFNTTFNNISVISWRSVLLVEETGVYGEKHRPAAGHWQTLSHNAVLSTTRLTKVRNHNFSGDRHSCRILVLMVLGQFSDYLWSANKSYGSAAMIGTDCTCSCKSNSHRIKTLMTPIWTEKKPISFNSTNTLCMYWAYMNWGENIVLNWNVASILHQSPINKLNNLNHQSIS